MNKKPEIFDINFAGGESTKYVLLSEYKSTRYRLGQIIAILFISIILNIFVFAVVIPDQHETIADQEKIIQILQKEINSSHKIKCEWIGK